MAISESSEHTESGFRRIPRHNLRSLSISGTRSTSSTRSATGCGSGNGSGSGSGGTKFGSLGNNRTTNSGNMEYAWMEPRHDPIVTDTNLAEIDFEDFRNEDLAYAFSCGVRNKQLSFVFTSLSFWQHVAIDVAWNFSFWNVNNKPLTRSFFRDKGIGCDTEELWHCGTAGLVFSKRRERRIEGEREQSG